MKTWLAAGTAALLWTMTALAADPTGQYDIEGTNPGGGGKYQDAASVEKTGDTYRVVWVVGGTRDVGTGIGNKDFRAVSYRSGNDTGFGLYGADGGNWAGIWTYAGGREVGSEIWKRR